MEEQPSVGENNRIKMYNYDRSIVERHIYRSG